MKFSRSIYLLIVLVFFGENAAADTYRVVFAPSSSQQSTQAGKTVKMELQYDDQLQRLTVIADVAPTPGNLPALLPDSFRIVLNATGNNPKGYDGELAIFYFDASDPADHKLAVYAYNSLNADTSYKDGSKQAGIQPPDQIVSSINSPGFLLHSIRNQKADGTRQLGFVAD